MLTVDPNSICDICSDQYGTLCLPYLIPCGHTFCRSCLMYLSQRITKGPSCPLCREPFTLEHIHLIRIDLADPLPKVSSEQSNGSDEADSDSSDSATSELRVREEAKQLELRVQKAASVKSTFQEVSSLRDDIQNWLLAEPKYKPISKFSALRLSAALLRAILLNSLSFSDAIKVAKITEDSLRDKIKILESQQTALQADIRGLQKQYSGKPDEDTQSRASPGKTTTSLFHSSPTPPSAANSLSLRGSSLIQSPSAPNLSSPELSPSPLPSQWPGITTPTWLIPHTPTTLPSTTGASSSRTSTRSRPIKNPTHHLRIRKETARSSVINADATPNNVSGTVDKVIARAKGWGKRKKTNSEKKQSGDKVGGSGSGSGSGELTYSESRSSMSGSGLERRTPGPPTSRSSLFSSHPRRHGFMAASKTLTAGRVFDPNEDVELSSDWSDHSPVVSRLFPATLQYTSSNSGLGAIGPAFARDNPPAPSRGDREERRDNREEQIPRDDRG